MLIAHGSVIESGILKTVMVSWMMRARMVAWMKIVKPEAPGQFFVVGMDVAKDQRLNLTERKRMKNAARET